MTKGEIVAALQEILEDSPIQRDKVLALRDRLQPAKGVKKPRAPRREKGDPENSLMGWMDIIKNS